MNVPYKDPPYAALLGQLYTALREATKDQSVACDVRMGNAEPVKTIFNVRWVFGGINVELLDVHEGALSQEAIETVAGKVRKQMTRFASGAAAN